MTFREKHPELFHIVSTAPDSVCVYVSQPKKVSVFAVLAVIIISKHNRDLG